MSKEFYFVGVLTVALFQMLLNCACSQNGGGVPLEYRRPTQQQRCVCPSGLPMDQAIQCFKECNPRGAVNIPVDYEHVGYEPEYIHGSHCMDMRTF